VVGTLVDIVVAVAVPVSAYELLKVTQLFEGVGSKFVPVIVTAAPGEPMVGVKPVIVGAAEVVTANGILFVAEPVGVVMAIGPVVAPLGTLVTICVVVAEVTVAAIPLKVTEF